VNAVLLPTQLIHLLNGSIIVLAMISWVLVVYSISQKINGSRRRWRQNLSVVAVLIVFLVGLIFVSVRLKPVDVRTQQAFDKAFVLDNIAVEFSNLLDSK